MPTRLVVWNVNRFSINTINDSSGKNTSEKLTNIVQSMWNNGFLRTIAATADIFVLIEVQSSRSVLGSLIGGSGEQGVLFLLRWLQKNHNANWYVVPPLKLVGLTDEGEKANYTEGIAVFFRNDRVNFTGPYIWPTVGNFARPAGSATAGPYPDPWTNALPANNYNAGQFEFFKTPLTRTGEFDWISGNFRRPFLTNFTEMGTGRVIKLLSVHPSPGIKKNVVQVVNSLSDIVEIQPSGSPQVVVVAGDFNINVKAAKKSTITGPKASTGYWSLNHTAGFSQKFGATATSTNGITTINQVNDTISEKTHQVTKAGSTPTTYLTELGIDNVFLRYDGGVAQPLANNPRIINPVTGTDEYASSMLQSLAQINQFYKTEPERVAQFRNVMNYGHIAHWEGVSDHLPLVIDI
jgi:endonuclease/exonuclease/phosphatase family metal-dependent hydrolase